MRKACSCRKYLSSRQSLASSTTERSMLPRYSSSLASNREKSAKASAALPANPARILSWYSRRTLAAPCFITVLPTVTCPSPAMATTPSRRTQRTVVAWIVSFMEGEVYRRRRFECAERLVPQLPGVQHEALRRRAAVLPVADDGMADRGQMDADLVRAAGRDAHVDQVAAHRRDLAVRGLPGDRRLDGARLEQRRRDARQILFLHGARGEELREPRRRPACAGEEHDAADLRIQPVHQENLAVLQAQDLLGRQERAIARRLSRHAGRLVDGDPVVGGSHHRERRHFGGDGDLRVIRNLARGDPHRALIDENAAGGDQLPRLAARDGGKAGGDGLVEAHAARTIPDQRIALPACLAAAAAGSPPSMTVSSGPPMPRDLRT